MTATLVTASYPAGLVLTNANYTYVSVAGTAVIGNPGGPALSGASTIGLTIVNSGSIQATGTTAASYGILLSGGSTVTNTSGGLITGVHAGVDITTAGSVVNQGSIAGVAGNGIMLPAGGVLVNGASGSVAGYRIGVSITGAGTVTNAGTITSSQTAGSGASYDTVAKTITVLDGGVVLGSGGVSNNATGVISSYFFGVSVYSGGSVTNQGRIAAGSTKTGLGMLLLNPGYVSNAASGTITSAYIGVLQPRGTGTVVNLGSIVSTHTMGGAVVRLLHGGTIGNEASGTIDGKWIGAQIYSNASGSAPGTILNAGIMLAADTLGDGAGAWIKGPGTVSNAASGTISGGAFGVVSYGYSDTVVNQGSIFSTDFAVQMGSGAANRVIVSPGASFTGTVDGGNTLTATAASALELAAGTGIGSIAGFGSKYIDFAEVTLDSGASWSLAGTVVAGETISFGGAGGLLTLANPGSVAGTITRFAAGDTIALGGVTDATSAILGAGNLLTVARSGAPSLTLQFDPAQSFSSDNFPFTVAGGNTDLLAPCFVAGTRIATASGETPVETLRVGDHLLSVFGGSVPVVWIGHRRVDRHRHESPRSVWPVRIRAGAFATRTPARDLWLSPDHAVYVDGLLIPAIYLVNGRSIVQVRVGVVTYIHVELPAHNVVLAEGLAAESYLDTGNRAAFASGGSLIGARVDAVILG
jgi:hypothetical protein